MFGRKKPPPPKDDPEAENRQPYTTQTDPAMAALLARARAKRAQQDNLAGEKRKP